MGRRGAAWPLGDRRRYCQRRRVPRLQPRGFHRRRQYRRRWRPPAIDCLAGADMIDLHHVSKTFRKQDETVDAVRDISLTIAQKEIVAIIGPSGCGKSTLLNMIAGLYSPSSGSIVYKGARVSDVNTDVGYMTQKDNLLPWRTVRDNVAFPLELAGVAKSVRADRADQVIAHVGLDGFAHRYPHELSGGMRKR